MPAKKDKSDTVLATEGLPKTWNNLVIKVSERICSDAFKRRLAFKLHRNNFSFKQLFTTVKRVHQ